MSPKGSVQMENCTWISKPWSENVDSEDKIQWAMTGFYLMWGLWTHSCCLSSTIKITSYPSHNQHTELSPKSPTCEIYLVLQVLIQFPTQRIECWPAGWKSAIFACIRTHPREEAQLLGGRSPSAEELSHWNAKIFPSSSLSWTLPPGQPAATSYYFLICCLINPYCGVCNCPAPCSIFLGARK